MTDFLLTLMEEWGIGVIYLSLLIEGSALPFIGTFFMVTVGFLLELTWLDITIISIIGSFLYALGSLIPYTIGYKLGNALESRLSPKQIEKVTRVKDRMNKHGVWSIAILSPLHLGNVIPFLAGMSNINIPLYVGLTMLGIAPSTFLFVSIGRFYDGSKESVVNLITEYQTYLLLGLVILTLLYLAWNFIKKHMRKEKGKTLAG